jgi:hypothetical protein
MEAATAPKPQHEVEITVNNKPVTVPKHTTGAQIKELAGVPADFQLFVVHGDHEDEIADDEKVTVHAKQRFIASSTLDPS